MKSVAMHNVILVIIRTCALLFFILNLSGCGYNDIQSADENIKAALNEVLNQYQRRSDLVPQLVNVVKGYANHESEVLTAVTRARASVAQVSVATSANSANSEQLVKYQQAQQQLDNALSRLLAVSERYPELKADTLFRDLMVQLEGTENRIAVARGRYVKAIQEYNTLIRQFPEMITAKVLGYKPQENAILTINNVNLSAPEVNFNKP